MMTGRRAELYLQLIALGIINARAASSLDEVVSETDHIHNLPSLVERDEPRMEEYYWDVERPAYLRDQVRLGFGDGLGGRFVDIWDELEPLRGGESAPTAAERLAHLECMIREAHAGAREALTQVDPASHEHHRWSGSVQVLSGLLGQFDQTTPCPHQRELAERNAVGEDWTQENPDLAEPMVLRRAISELLWHIESHNSSARHRTPAEVIARIRRL